jgi:hypothetical protein
MRHAIVLAAGLCTLATAAAYAGDAKAPDLSAQSCGVATPYDVRIDDAGVRLRRSGGSPGEILIHDGALSVDRQPQPVDEADALRLREMEQEARALMPEAADIARDSVQLTFDALARVIRTMTGSERKARRIESYRDRALADIDGSLGQGRWDQQAFAGTFEADVTQAAEDAAHGLVRSALWAVFTGRAHRLDERADQVDREVDKLVEARSAVLQHQAQALCARVTRLRQLQDALDYRYAGAPLAMIEPSPAPAGTPPDATASAEPANTP